MLFPCLENPVEEHLCSTSQCELIVFVPLLLTHVYCAKVFSKQGKSMCSQLTGMPNTHFPLPFTLLCRDKGSNGLE